MNDDDKKVLQFCCFAILSSKDYYLNCSLTRLTMFCSAEKIDTIGKVCQLTVDEREFWTSKGRRKDGAKNQRGTFF
jgi:hypothetical protein